MNAFTCRLERPPPPVGILSTIGNTPLVQLGQLFARDRFELFAKLEASNPGGSMKDRPALRMVQEALARGQINRHSVLVESSSGNLGIGLAQVCGALRLRLLVVVDPKVTQTNLKILRAYGAGIDMVSIPDPETGEYLSARRKRVAWLAANLPGAVNLNQYANPDNPAAHQHGTVSEILNAVDDKLDWLVISISTCGTLKGARLAVRERGLATRILAVDAAGSVIFGQAGPRLLPGHGAGIVPEHMADDLAGASSGGVVAAIERWHTRWPAGSRVAAILPDRGERYLDTVYDDAWCERHFGGVPQLRAIPFDPSLPTDAPCTTATIPAVAA